MMQQTLTTIREGKEVNAAIWLLCHYPETSEADVRIIRAVALHKQWGFPIWLYGSNSARYPESVERLMKRQIMKLGVAPEAILCSGDNPLSPLSLDTVQEAKNVVGQAKQQGLKTLICISNRLQLLQVKALLRHESLNFVWVSTPLRDWRWWYVLGRVVLIPLAFLGIGPNFAPLLFVRWARARIASWPF